MSIYLDDHHWLYCRSDRQVHHARRQVRAQGFILTAVLGIVGAFVATYLGQAVGWYKPGEGAGFIGGIIGAIILLFLYGLVMGRQGRA